MSANKRAYFQGGGGCNEPEPKKVKYKVEPSITVQPRFVEPFYYNYDLYNTEGLNGPAKHGPGAGYHNLFKFKSVKEYLQHQRQRLKDKYVADDTYITDSNRKERIEMMKTRTNLLARLIKYASDDNEIDFPFDSVEGDLDSGYIIGNSESYDSPRQLGPAVPDATVSPNQVNLGDIETYPNAAQLGGYMDKYLTLDDTDGKQESTLDFSNDLIDNGPQGGRPYDSADADDEDEREDLLKTLEKKYNPAPPEGIFGLPDGVNPTENPGDPTNIQPYYGTYGPESTMYGDKWNI